MPSAKLGTVVKDVTGSVKDMIGASEYREKLGVVRCAVGQLGFTPDEMQRNVRAFIGGVKKDIAALSDRIGKDIHEVVSVNSFPFIGFSMGMHRYFHIPLTDIRIGIELDEFSRLHT